MSNVTIADWSAAKITSEVYRAKFLEIVRILTDWYGTSMENKDVLEFGCGEGTTALSLALQHNPKRVVGVEVLDVYNKCLSFAQEQIGLQSLPSNFNLYKIFPGEELLQFGKFDFIYSWSVFEHVQQDLLPVVLKSIRAALKKEGLFFLQISPLYYSAMGSHLYPWVSIPWGHLLLQQDRYYQQLFEAPDTPSAVRDQWSVYIPLEAEKFDERRALWDTYFSLNKVTVPYLCRLVQEAGFEIVRDYRTKDEFQIPQRLAEIFNEDIITTQQIVLLMRPKQR